jgi:hypothetical protein
MGFERLYRILPGHHGFPDHIVDWPGAYSKRKDFIGAHCSLHSIGMNRSITTIGSVAAIAPLSAPERLNRVNGSTRKGGLSMLLSMRLAIEALTWACASGFIQDPGKGLEYCHPGSYELSVDHSHGHKLDPIKLNDGFRIATLCRGKLLFGSHFTAAQHGGQQHTELSETIPLHREMHNRLTTF